jgi:hypothetical protein
MKKHVLIFFILLCTAIIPLSAQEQTLANGETESGGFGGVVLKVTQIHGEIATLVGGRGAWIINHTFAFGGAGYGLVTHGLSIFPMGYGGLDFEYFASSNDLIHLSIGLLAGAGGVGYKNETMTGNHRSFWVLEPSVQANLNVTHSFRIAAGVSYRYVSGVKSVILTNDDLSGLSAIFALEFGNF